ncbi:FMN-binding protein [Tumebacillus sp. ITR2]|uniref:FMN-binding protein n=2 Tax=Tumebacillus amylolyticus TaxID=2801339 RepID=A0ABS1J4Q1_9BACL|nr:FMN-binding protein [Tumebacillus amylolyticus]
MAAVNSPDSHTAPNQQQQQGFQGQRGRDHGGRFPQGQRGDAPPGNGNFNNQAPNTTPNGGQSKANTQGQTSNSNTTSSASTGTYKDGTYTGMGSNRIGSVEVAVTIQGGKIAAVEITNCDTHYPQSRIDGLPAQAVERQSSKVDTVSGATKSTDDFRNAMNQALAQAQA